MFKKYKKPKKAHGLCEAAVGMNPNSRQPQIILCRKPGAWLYFDETWNNGKYGAVLCEDCRKMVEERDNARKAKENAGNEVGG